MTDHWVRVAKQNWVFLIQWKVRAEMERITSKNEKFLMKKGQLEKEVKVDVEKVVSKNKYLSKSHLMDWKEARLYLLKS